MSREGTRKLHVEGPQAQNRTQILIYFDSQQSISFFQNIFSNHAQSPKGQCLWLNKNQRSYLKEFRCTESGLDHIGQQESRRICSCLQTKAALQYLHCVFLCVVYDLKLLFVCNIWHCLRTWIYLKHEQAENRWTMWNHLHPLSRSMDGGGSAEIKDHSC